MNHFAQLEELRARIRPLIAERKALEDAGRTRDEVRAEISRKVRVWHEEARRKNSRDLRLLASGQFADLVDVSTPQGAGPLLTLMLGPAAVEKALLAEIEEVPVGIDSAQRAERIAATSRELDALEGEEESLIEVLEAAGEVVWRRPDARPEIVLGPNCST